MSDSAPPGVSPGQDYAAGLGNSDLGGLGGLRPGSIPGMSQMPGASQIPNMGSLSPGGSLSPLGSPSAAPQGGGGFKGMDSLGFVMDVPVEVTVELGRKHVRIGEILRLGPGSILELSKANGEPLDIFVNNQLIARGEAVVVGERYGVRLTEVLVDGSGQRE